MMNHPLLIPARQALSPDQFSRLNGQLTALLASQAALYQEAHGFPAAPQALDSMTDSLLFALGVRQDASPTFWLSLSCENLARRLRRSTQELQRKADAARRLIRGLHLSAADFGAAALAHSLAHLFAAVSDYDVRFGAHRVPGVLDYPLLRPVPDTLQGVDHTLASLALLALEWRFISRFRAHRAYALLDGASPAWREEPVSLYAPLAAHALGLALLGEAPLRLHMRACARDALLERLRPMREVQIEAAVFAAAPHVCRALDLSENEDFSLLYAFCLSFNRQLINAVRAGDLSGVFFPFSLPRL